MPYKQSLQGLLTICRKAGKLAMGLEPAKDALYRGTAAGLLAVVVQQVDPWLDWLRTLDVYFQGQSPAVLLRVLGIALVAQFAADTCREAGLCAASTAIELCGRVLVLLQALPLLRSLLGSFADYLQ